MNHFSQNDAVDNLSWSIAMRFGIVLLGCVSLSLSGGQALTPDVANLCYLFGLSGMAFYFALELVADQRMRRQKQAVSQANEQHLSRRVQAEKRLAAQHDHDVANVDSAGFIESAVDSTADLDVYLGPMTQPTLSM